MVRSRDARWLTKGVLAVALVGMVACSEQQSPLSPPSFALSDPTGNQTNPWTGRSGTAAVTAYARFLNGGAALTVTSYHENDVAFATPVGCISKIQVKVFRSGRLVSTQNFNSLNAGSFATVQVRGAQIADRLSLQVNVSCIEPNPKRTNVVPVDVDVIAPNITDPAVIRLKVPGTPLTSAPVTISAYVKVPRGLAAASGSCVLYVDGAVVGSLPPMTIAAGDSVPCPFTSSFPVVGMVRITVAFENVSPTDLNPANNSASTLMPVYAVPPTIEFTADLYDDTLTYHDLYMHSLRVIPDAGALYDTLPAPLPGLTVAQTVDRLYPMVDSAYTSTDRVGNDQHAQVVGIINTRVAFPLAILSVSQRSGTTTYHAQSWSNVASNDNSAGAECAILLVGTVDLSICAYLPEQGFPNGKTVISYTRDTSNAAERLVAYKVGPESPASDCVPTSTNPDDNCFSVTTAAGPTLVAYSSTYTFTLTVQDPTHRFTATVETGLSLARTLIGRAPPASYEVQVDGETGTLGRWRQQQGELTDRLRYSGPIASLTRLTETVAP